MTLSLSATFNRRMTRTYDTTNLTKFVEYLADNLTPIGTIIAKLSDKPPSPSWLELKGQSLSKAVYADLYADVGGAYGETATHFALPDPSEAYLIGAGAETSGFVGANSLTLTVGQLPSHTHDITDPGHNHEFTGAAHGHNVTDTGHTHVFTGAAHTHTLNDPGHSHSAQNPTTGLPASSGAGIDTAHIAGSTGGSVTGISLNETTAGGTNSSAETGVVVNDATADGEIETAHTGITAAQTGGGAAIDKRPRSLIIYYFVKALQ